MRPTWLLLLAGITLPATPLAAQRLEPSPFPRAAVSFRGQVPPTPPRPPLSGRQPALRAVTWVG
jgi:hypothetical protein